MVAVARHRDVLGCPLDLAALAKADPADLRKRDAAAVDGEALGEPDALPAQPSSLLEPRQSRREFGIERPPIGDREVFERLLQRLGMDLAQERELAFEVDQVLAHGFIAQAFLAAFVPKFVQRQQLVPEEARAADKAPQERSFGLGRLESKAIPLATRHNSILTQRCAIRMAFLIGATRLAPYVPALNDGALRRNSVKPE